jgi:hypothetical protein
VFILYAIPIGLLAGFALGGSLERLGRIQVRLAWVAVLAVAVQLVLFSPLGDAIPADAGRAIYVASTAAVLIVVLANVRVPGIPLVVAGAALNLAAILANGGAMPADPAALATAGIALDGPSNSVVVADPALRPLTDIYALPGWLPLANVFSVGDVLIGLGVVVVIAAAMRTPIVLREPGPRTQ